ncbi:beta-phosphoglucomutase [Sphingomonas sp. LaA6.9]|uniref:beta-phosphoglucomutase n=1 Tax=Sphingomonas sp. LaA6.9 TaxID=2919914 RepID=UPI001F4F3580|nr:beta-phosphoglucomutase [Sphingomonas sp. LaA6.9]MCJ8156739.1 beta-phosphoglucomutase [Sphingomonas sp. LaA6.9]
MTRFRAAVFDLDGVLADSAVAHFAAWKRIADDLSIPFDAEANEALKGVDRMGSLRHILALGNVTLPEAEMVAIATRKNGYYLDAVAAMTPADLLPGAAALVARARALGMKTAIASASRNAPTLLARLGIASDFDFIADAGAVAASKPAPDIFLACTEALGVAPGDAIGFEDSAAGIEAILAAGMIAVGIGVASTLARAHIVFPTTAEADLDAVIARF